jgi:hypothetical protein
MTVTPLGATTTGADAEPSPAQQILSPSNEAGAVFGSHLSLSGDRVAIGSVTANTNGIEHAGAVHIFERVGSEWQHVSQPIPSDPGISSNLGTVALQGTRLLVGASGHAAGIGAAYIFERTPAGDWTQRGRFAPDNPTTSCVLTNGCHRFGIAVALDGDTAIVGASRENDRKGAVYVFVRDALGNWAKQQRLTANDSSTYPHFGSAVALQGDTLLIGAEFQDVSGVIYRGATYVFTRNVGTWTQRARLSAADGEARDNFGSTLALDADTALIGSRLANLAGQNNRGAVYAFVRSTPAIWNLQARLNASDGVGEGPPDHHTGDLFGLAMALHGDIAWIGKSPGNLTTPLPDRYGSVYQFVRTAGLWNEMRRFTPAAGSPGDGFGASIAFDAKSLLVGAPYEGTAPGEPAERGMVYAYTLPQADLIFADDFDS